MKGKKMNTMIEVTGLKKSYGDVDAVRGIDFSVERGGLFAFLGPNGAGKSTTIDMISTQLAPSAGQITVDGLRVGKDDAAIRSRIGIVFQDSVLDTQLTVRENLALRARFYGLAGAERKAAVERAANAADVTEFIDRYYGKLSGGQRRRADIARALINTPKLLFLDEPTTGLDPQTRRKVWETVLALKREHGMTVFLTTHYMEEAAQADSVTVIDHGSLLAEGTPAQLKERYTSDMLHLSPIAEQAVLGYLTSHSIAHTQAGGEIKVPLAHTLDALSIVEGVAEHIEGFEVVRGSMDDVFINLTGEEIRS